jgi:hypothetical protein
VNEPTSAVWKYELGPGVTVLQLPVGAVALHVGYQAGGVFLWALVIAERAMPTGKGPGPMPTEPRAFLTLGTGHRTHPATIGRHVGTVQSPAEADGLVWHVFETGLPEPSSIPPVTRAAAEDPADA